MLEEWQNTGVESNKILVEYGNTLHSDITLPYSVNWLFTNTFRKAYMKSVVENVRRLACNNEPYLCNLKPQTISNLSFLIVTGCLSRTLRQVCR